MEDTNKTHNKYAQANRIQSMATREQLVDVSQEYQEGRVNTMGSNLALVE